MATNDVTHLPSLAMIERASLSERRARVGPWVWFADTADIVEGVYDGTRLCTVCSRMIGEGELDFLIVLASAVALRVDQECLELWREAVMNARRRASIHLDYDTPSTDRDNRQDCYEGIVGQLSPPATR
jgi:hypothetical protein